MVEICEALGQRSRNALIDHRRPRCEALSLRTEMRASDRVVPYFGVRWLDGGTDNDEVLTFATVYYALAGVMLHF